MTMTTGTPSALETALTAVCGWCGQVGRKADMTWDGEAFYCAAVPPADASVEVQQAYVTAVAACTTRGQLRREDAKQEAAAAVADGALDGPDTAEPATDNAETPAGDESAAEAETPAGDAA